MGEVKLTIVSLAEWRAYRRLRAAVAQDAFFDDWWPGIDDAIYQDEHASEAVTCFRAALLEHAGFPKAKKQKAGSESHE